MNKSNIFLMTIALVILTGMYVTNAFLKEEYLKIDLTDPYKNYISVPSESYSVLDISGSNGYPIDIVHKKTNDIKVLRSRLDHFKSDLRNDTLFIQYTGSNIPMNQRYRSNTPAGIVIENNELVDVVSTNTHNRFTGFTNQNLKLTLKGNSLMEISNCDLYTMEIDMKNDSQIDFSIENRVDSLVLNMANKSAASLQKIDFRSINHSLSDSITLVLSKNTFNNILK